MEEDKFGLYDSGNLDLVSLLGNKSAFESLGVDLVMLKMGVVDLNLMLLVNHSLKMRSMIITRRTWSTWEYCLDPCHQH